jgi:WD40 repeat protein
VLPVLVASLMGALSASASAPAAPGGGEEWTGRYDGPGHAYDVAYAAAVSPDGSTVFVTGSSEGAGSLDDYATIAYDATTGAPRWARRYNGPGNESDYAYAVAVSPDGTKVFVTGRSPGPNMGDAATIAYDAATGATDWVRRYDGPGHDSDYGFSLTTSPDGSRVFVAASSSGGVNRYDYATIAYDAATGATDWVRRYDGPGDADDLVASIASSPDGSGVFVTGTSSSGAGRFDDDYATVAYDAATGTTRWLRRYDGPGHRDDVASSLALSPDGSTVVVTGGSSGAAVYSDFGTVGYDAATGAVRWVGRYDGPGSGSDTANAVAVAPDGSVAVVTGGSDGSEGSADYATLAYDLDTGVLAWARRYDGPAHEDDTAAAIAAAPDGSAVYVTGGSDGTAAGDDYATVAYDAATGAPRWIHRSNGTGNGDDYATWIVAATVGSRVFVTGWSYGPGGSDDYATVAFAG